MRAYEYFLFRIYMFYKNKMKDKRNLLLPTSFVSTTIIWINLMTIYFYFIYKDLVPAVPNKYFIVGFMIIIWLINYYSIIIKENFLKRNFHIDVKGGIAVIGYIIMTFFIFIVLANYNREKIFKYREINKIKLESHQ